MDHVVSYIVWTLCKIYDICMCNKKLSVYEFITSLHKRFSTRNDNYRAFVFMIIMITSQIRVEIHPFFLQ